MADPNGSPSSDTAGNNSDDELSHDDYRISLYYCYVDIEDDVNMHVSFQKELCEELSLKGRIRVSSEGLNGVLSGRHSTLMEYQQCLETEMNVEAPLDIKYCLLRKDLSVESQLFESLVVKATREVVSLYEPVQKSVQRNGQSEDKNSRGYYRRRRRNRQKHEQQQQALQQEELSEPVVPESPLDDRLTSFDPAPHLTPEEWNARLSSDPNAILVDARNVYESRVGYFQVEGVPTLLTNTRKYSSLPQVLQESKEELAGKNIYMYCTGGVRCERASVFLQALSASATTDNGGAQQEKLPKEIFQLDGGIQRYLEHYGGVISPKDTTVATTSPASDCLFRGRNFVFDQRRTDPIVGKGLVGTCLLCNTPHDDYDNGYAPCENKEARCHKCRVLVLICDACRPTVCVWGEEPTSIAKEMDGEAVLHRPKVYCGGDHCVDEGNSIQATIAAR
jgi:predicted sulfurtransferase